MKRWGSERKGLFRAGVWVALLLLGWGPAAVRADGPTDATPEKWAVIAGINEYQSESLNDLDFSVRDARGIFETLTDADIGGLKPDHVVLLTSDQPSGESPTAAHIRAALRQLAAKARPQDTFWFYFSGHGTDRSGKSYLLTQGFNLSRFPSPDVCLTTSEIRQILQPPTAGGLCRAERKIIILDSCHSGSTRGITGPQQREQQLRGEGMVTLAACQTNQSSWEYPQLGGVFTFYLRAGLAGDADKPENGGDGDGKVSIAEIDQYLRARVDQYVYKAEEVHQNPVIILDPKTRDLKLTVCRQSVATELTQQAASPQTLVSRPPLGPPVVVSFDETVSYPDGRKLTAGKTTETLVRQALLQHSLPVLDPTAAQQLQSVWKSKDLKLVSLQVQKSNARYLLRGQATVSIQELPEFTGPDGLTVRLYNATATVSVELVSDTGQVQKTLVVTSGQQTGTQLAPGAIPTSPNPERAATIALTDAATQAASAMTTQIQQLTTPSAVASIVP